MTFGAEQFLTGGGDVAREVLLGGGQDRGEVGVLSVLRIGLRSEFFAMVLPAKLRTFFPPP
jgi:hypothetical protein